VQTHQAVETQNWLDEAKKMQTEGIVYVAQLDGEEAESHIPQLRELTKENKNIFVGNAEQIIDWLS
jgi:2-succinyl-5-enolpyruvyl-6-hydroxy-3-cyclohexene-1-carboxylate synthase